MHYDVNIMIYCLCLENGLFPVYTALYSLLWQYCVSVYQSAKEAFEII